MFIKTLTLTTFLMLATTTHDPLPDLKLGTSLPAMDHAMKDVSGQDLTLKQVAGSNGLLVIFSCNTCPFIIGSEGREGWEGRYPGVAAEAMRQDIGVAFINSNEAKRNDGDSFADMQERYKTKGLKGHYLLDTDHVVADAFGARTTPHVFLFDKNMQLVYKGAIDDSVDSAAKVNSPWLMDAMKQMVTGGTVDPATTRNIGCSVKRMPHKH